MGIELTMDGYFEISDSIYNEIDSCLNEITWRLFEELSYAKHTIDRKKAIVKIRKYLNDNCQRSFLMGGGYKLSSTVGHFILRKNIKTV